MSNIEATHYAAPSAQVLRFMAGVEAYCVKSDEVMTQNNLAKAKQQIADALNRRSEQGVRLPVTDRTVIQQSASPKIQDLIASLSCQTPAVAISLAGRVTA
ncbi:MAG: hypothetical protein WCN87_03885 [Chlamydiota bacterium]